MSEARARFERYASDRRGQTIPSFDRDDRGHVLRYTAQPPEDEGFVVFATLTEGREARQIDDEVAHFRSRSQSFEWKVHAFDRPFDLAERLAAAGFVADACETLMLLDGLRSDASPPTGCDIRRIDDDDGLADLSHVLSSVWPADAARLRSSLGEQLRAAPGALSVFCAYRDGEPVGSGWIDYPPGSRVPDLHGGAVVTAARGRGIYRALFEVRRREAAERGFDTLAVDASPMSRPILERLGFVPICATTPMRMRRD